VQQPSVVRHGAAVLSAVATFVFFTLVWHGTVADSWASALGLGAWMGLVVLGSLWFARRPGNRGCGAPAGSAGHVSRGWRR
jgi:hypothetical protein